MKTWNLIRSAALIAAAVTAVGVKSPKSSGLFASAFVIRISFAVAPENESPALNDR